MNPVVDKAMLFISFAMLVLTVVVVLFTCVQILRDYPSRDDLQVSTNLILARIDSESSRVELRTTDRIVNHLSTAHVNKP